MKKNRIKWLVFVACVLFAFPAFSQPMFFYAGGGGGGGGDMQSAIYDPAGGAQQVAFEAFTVNTTAPINGGPFDLSLPSATIGFDASGVVAATYTVPTIDVDIYGRITSAVNGSGVLVPAGTTNGQVLYWGGASWLLSSKIFWDDTTGQLQIRYDPLNFFNIYSDASGDAVIDNTLTIGSGEAGVDYELKFDGNTNDGNIIWDDSANLMDFPTMIQVWPIQLSSTYISNDGDSEGLQIDNSGNVYCSDTLFVSDAVEAANAVFTTTAGNQLELEYDATNKRSILIDAAGNATITQTGDTTTTNGLSNLILNQSLADLAFVDIPANAVGYGHISLGDTAPFEWAHFVFNTNTVTLVTNSINVAAIDSIGNLCIFYNGTNVRIRNRLGATYTIRGNVFYSP